MTKATEAMLIYALVKCWDGIMGANEKQLVACATSYYLAGASDNETKIKIDDIYQVLRG